MNISNITFEVPRLSNFVFKKSSEKNIFSIIFVVKSLKGFGWNNLGLASQAVAQHDLTIGPMYRVINIVTFRGIKCHPYGSQSKHGAITNPVSMLGQYDCPALNQQWAATLAQHWTGIGWIDLHCVAWMLARTVDGGGRNRPTRWRYTCLLGSFNNFIIIYWTFRILVHEDNQ